MDFEPTLSPRFVACVRDYLMDRGVEPDPVFAHSRAAGAFFVNTATGPHAIVGC